MSHQVIASLPQLPLDQPEDARLAGTDIAARRAARARATVQAERPAAPAAQPPRGFKGLALRAVRLLGMLDRWTPTRWGKRIFVLPIGERFALISITAALWSPHVTFVALLVWGGAATVYMLAGRILRAVAR